MWDFLVIVVVIAGATAVYQALGKPRYLFNVRIRNGSVRLQRGKLAQSQLMTLREVVREHQIARGWIAGERHGRLVRLVFSRGFPGGAAQQLRNLWNS